MRKKLLTKHCALLLLAIIAATWSTTAWAGVTINVKSNQTIYLYAWDNDENPLFGDFPGTEMTKTTNVQGETWYTKTFPGYEKVNFLLSLGGDNVENTKTGDLSSDPNNKGVKNGNVYYEYDPQKYGDNKVNNLTDLYDIPVSVTYEPSNVTVYYVNTNSWNNPYVYISNGNAGMGNQNNNWPGDPMTKIGTNSNGWDIYKWSNNYPNNPNLVIFSNNGNNQTSNIPYTRNGYYSGATNSGCIAEIGTERDGTVIYNTPAYFNDAKMRTALEDAFRVPASSTNVTDAAHAIVAKSVKVLDVSNHEISNLGGVENFTQLEELYAQNNSINRFGYSPEQTSLKVLNLSNNPNLKTTMSSYNASDYNGATGRIYILGFSGLEELYLDDCDFGGTGGGIGIGSSSSVLPNLKILSAKNNPNLNAMSTLKNGAHLEYINLSNCGLSSTALGRDNFNGAGGTNLKYLDVSDNPNLYSVYLNDKSNLETIIMKNCTSYDYGSFNYCKKLKHADFSGCTGLTSTMWDHLKPETHADLQYLNLSNGTTSVNNNTFSFPALDTLIVNNHNGLTTLKISSHCPSIIDITNDANLTTLSITGCGLHEMPSVTDLSTTTALTKIDLSNNNFTAVPEVASATVTTMVMNSNQLSTISAPSNIKYLYAEDNNFGTGEFEMPATNLVGLDLANNGFTKFKMTGNTTLKALTLAVDNSRNSTLTEIELHGNTKLTQTSPNGNIEISDCDEEDETTQDRFNKGLYIKGLSNLHTLNIENSNFEKLGQGRSLEGLTGLTKLQARKNKFTTFTNGVYALDVAGSGNYRIADPTESTLEDLPALEYLDLAYNNLQDSVHLYKNVNLKHLDVSHNRTIHGVYDGAITPDDTKAQKAMRAKKAFNLMKYGKVYNGVGVNPTVGADWVDGLPPEQAATARPFDIRYEDLNDTIGLYHLNLCMNTKLEYLDISYTNIHNTASGPTFMNPGWMDKDWVEDMGVWDAVSSPNTPENRAYMRWHTFVYIIPCYKLKEFHTDHNNMRSLGVRYFPELEILTSNNMYGDGDFMRDYGNYGNGNIGLSGEVQILDKVKWSTNDDGDVTATLSFVGPNGSGSYYPNPTKYLDLSNSGFNEIRVNNGVNLEYLDVSGNPLNFALHDQTKSYNNSLDVTYCPNIKTVKADNCSDLPIVRAYNRPALTTLNLDGDTKLKALYIQKDPKLSLVSADAEDERACFTGLSTLEGLETLFAYTNPQFGGIDVTKNTALKNLWISNIGASSINLSKNTALTKLRIYDNSLAKLDLENNTALTWLDLARNQVPRLDLSSNTALQYFNCSNSEETLDDQSLAANSHNGGEADNVKPTTGSSKAINGGNSLSDLVFYSNIADVRANYNDLHKITGGFAGLTNIEYAHNHINGINLSAANLSNLTVNSEDNGRTITADCATFRKKVNGTVQEYKVYFFQLQNVEGNGAQLTTKTSTDGKGTTRVLGTDGLALDNITAWTSDAAVLAASTTGAHLNSTITPDDMSALDPGDVPGQIVVLKPTNEDAQGGATGEAQYSYNDGFESGHISTYYLKWSSNGTVTGISQIDPDQDFNIENTSGSLIVTGSDGTTVGVYDMNGRLVANEVITGGKATITGLTPGIYIVNGNKVLIK